MPKQGWKCNKFGVCPVMSVYQKHKNRWFQHCRRKSNDKQVNCHTSSKIWAPWLLSTCSTNAVCLSLVRGESKPERHSGKRIIAGTAFPLRVSSTLICVCLFFLLLFNSRFLPCRKQNILQKNECTTSENEWNTVQSKGFSWITMRILFLWRW